MKKMFGDLRAIQDTRIASSVRLARGSLQEHVPSSVFDDFKLTSTNLRE